MSLPLLIRITVSSPIIKARLLIAYIEAALKNKIVILDTTPTRHGNFLVKDLMTPLPPLGVENVKIRENSE